MKATKDDKNIFKTHIVDSLKTEFLTISFNDLAFEAGI